jgi:antitoxin PrlF
VWSVGVPYFLIELEGVGLTLGPLTSRGQVTIAKRIRDALHLLPGTEVEFTVNAAGEIVIQRHSPDRATRSPVNDPFEAARGRVDVRWKTDDSRHLLRADD